MFFKQRLLIVALYFVISVYTSFACVPPTRNSNSWYSPRRYQYSYGDSITYKCEQGYVAVGGSQTITCSTYHRWSGSPLICTRQPTHQRTCARPADPLNGKVLSYPGSKRTFSNHQYVFYRCNEGYELRGLKRAQCIDGSWSHAAFCNKISVKNCPRRPPPTSGNYAAFQVKKSSWNVGEVAILMCDRGYTLVGRGLSVCLSDFTWSSSIPTCRRNLPQISCTHRYAPRNGQYISSQARKTTWRMNDVATYQCRSGYVMSGDRSSQCLVSGHWSSDVPRCRLTCSNRDPPDHGSYSGRHSTTWFVEDVARFHCDEGYAMVGQVRSSCQSSGSWSNPVPQCRRSCPHREPPHKGRYANKHANKTTWFERDVAQYTCDNGYVMSGHQQSVCLNSGTWSRNVPSCNLRACPHRSGPQHGGYAKYQSSKTTWYPLEVAVFKCKENYVMVGRHQSTCTTSGSWSTRVPTCARKCPRRSPPDNGAYYGDNKSVWVDGDVARFSCSRGYVLSGESRSTCHSSGAWSSSLPHCRRVCPKRDPPPHGKYVETNKTTWAANDVARYKCNPGYIITGHSYSTCQSNGVWSSALPTCHRMCPHRSPPRYGKYTLLQRSKKVWLVGEQALFVCNDGYVSNSLQSQCLSTGRWSNNVPVCRRRKCPNRPPPEHGNYISRQRTKTVWNVNEEAIFICVTGYQLSGVSRSRCLKSGSWSSDLPVCRYISRSCVRPRNPQYGSVHSYPNTKHNFEDGEFIEYQCNSGYQLQGHARVSCSNGVWGDKPVCREIPRPRVSCNRLSPPLNGKYIPSQRNKTRWFAQEKAQFRCDIGYHINGNKQVTCLPSGYWSSRVPACERTCPNRQPPENGAYATPRIVWRAGERAQFVCRTGYTLKGPQYSTCSPTGVWSSTLPTCHRRRITCPHRGPPENGYYIINQQRKTTWQENESAAFRCNRNYIISGRSRSVCLSSGRWSTDVPTCRERTNLNCPHRQSPQHGRYIGSQAHKTSWRQQEVARFQCDHGYTLVGNHISKCLQSGRWSTAVPKCQHSCPHLPPPTHGSYIPAQADKTNWYPGDAATFLCYPGYSTQKNSVYCLQGGRWSGSVPSCKPNPTCTRPRNPANGEFQTNPPEKQRFSSGEHITLHCNQYYEVVGNKKVRCVGKSWEKIPICRLKPTCPHRSAPSHGYFLLGQDKTVWYSGDSARFACHEGYTLVGNNHVTCQTNSVWSAAIPRCVAGSHHTTPHPPPPPHPHQPDPHSHHGVTCPHRYAPTNGIYIQDVGKTVWHVGDIARYRCDPNFILVGHDYTDCRPDGTWRFSVPTCQANDNTFCKRPSNPTHGSVFATPNKKSQFQSGEYVDYRCHSGYRLNGNSRVICKNGVWQRAPRCVGDGSQVYHGSTTPPHIPHPTHTPHTRVSCPERYAPENGRYMKSKQRWMTGDVAQFTCSEGFELVGQSHSMCQTDGTWQSEVPTCRRIIQAIGSCRGQCGAFDVGGCSCDPECTRYFDCCNDFQFFCNANSN